MSLFCFRNWEPIPNLILTSDSAKSAGLRIIFGNKWCSCPWPEDTPADIHIAILELIPVIVAAHIWGHRWERRRIDNAAAVHSVNSGLPKDLHLSYLVRKLAILATVYSFTYRAEHIPGIHNGSSYALSRGNFSKFRELMPNAELCNTSIPIEFLRELLWIPASPDFTFQ